jgi:hypothetical protein
MGRYVLVVGGEIQERFAQFRHAFGIVKVFDAACEPRVDAVSTTYAWIGEAK